jgi:hypothetical protein
MAIYKKQGIYWSLFVTILRISRTTPNDINGLPSKKRSKTPFWAFFKFFCAEVGLVAVARYLDRLLMAETCEECQSLLNRCLAEISWRKYYP